VELGSQDPVELGLQGPVELGSHRGALDQALVVRSDRAGSQADYRHLVLRATGSLRDPLGLAGASSAAITADLDSTASTAFTIAIFSLTTASDAGHPSFSAAVFFWDHLSFPISRATTMATITATALNRSNSP
jgi:hypothetical protein